MEYMDIEDPMQDEGKTLANVGFNSQMGFVKKVYSILSCQLLVTSVICGIAVASKSYTAFQLANPWLFYLCIALQFVVMITLFCFKDQARKVPNNYILLGLFTFFESYIVSFLCGIAPPMLVLQAAILTCGMFLALTYYAWTTKSDFTMMGGLLFVCAIVMMIAGLFLMFFHSNIAHLIYCCFGVILFSLYIIYDTQLMIGGKQYSYDIDDYIIAALNLYIDIIQLFIYILQILQSTND